MEKAIRNLLSACMATVLCIQAIPSFAVTTEDLAEDRSSASNLSASDNSDLGYNAATGELTALREESVKHFRLPDGTCQAIAYGSPVHRKDADGNWQDIDNRLETGQIGSSRLTTSDGTRSFSLNASSNELFTLRDGEHILSMSAAFACGQTASATASVQNHGELTAYALQANTSGPEALVSADTTTRVTYENVSGGVDLEYILEGNDIKENIILNSASEGDYRYIFQLYLTGLDADLLEDGSIGLYDSDTGELSYLMPAPYMYDENGEISYDVSYDTVSVDNRLFIAVEASSEWINDADRAFPVVIDPTLTRNATRDTYISSQYPDTNYGSSSRIWISANATAFIYIPMPTLPSNATITGASLNVAYYYYDSVTSGSIRVGAYLMGQSWTESGLTWTSANRTTNLGIAPTQLSTAYMYGNVGATETSPKWATFSIPSVVKDMYAGIPNYGFALKYLSGTNSSVILKSKEAGSTYCPYLSIVYQLDELIVSNGTYILKNGLLNNYIQPDDSDSPNYSTNNAAIELHSFNGGTHQKWQITYLHNGYYRIICSKNNKALSVQIGEENTENASLVQTTRSPNYQQQWKITKTSHGMYKIKARSSESNTADLCMASETNGSNVEQRKFVDDMNYNDEWLLFQTDKTVVHLDIIYDQAYSNRYSNAESRINEQVLMLQEAFITGFEIWIEVSSPSLFSSYADLNCSTSYNYSCTHATNTECYNSSLYVSGNTSLQTYHHNNIYNIMLRIPFPDTDTTVKIAYIGHDNCICTRDGNSVNHKTNPYYGLTYKSIGLITVMNFSSVASEIKTTAHEFGHLYNAPDHYGGSAPSTDEIIISTGDSRFDRNCIYGENKGTPDVLNNLTICDGCKAIINANKDKYDHMD
ncbi:MAG: DNRLRE domain-containing protein [Eubacteriales bacterium]